MKSRITQYSFPIIEQFNGVALVLDRDFNFLFYNPFTEQIFKNNDIPEPKTFWELVETTDQKRVDSELISLWEDGGESTLSFRICQSDKEHWLALKFQMISINEEQLLLGIGQTIDAPDLEKLYHLETEAALKDAEVIGKMGSWWVNPITMENHWSEGNYRIWNRNPNEKPPSVDWVLQRLHPKDADKVLKAIKDVGEKGKSIQLQFRMRLNEEEPYRYFLSRVRPWYVNGKLVEVKGVNFEITELVNYQNELLDKNRELENRNKRLSKYVQMNSHDVRGPLSNILSLLEWQKVEEVSMSEFVNHLEAAALKLDSTLNRINKTLVDKANEEENAKISTSIPQGNK